jgi:acetyl esterase/lipase
MKISPALLFPILIGFSYTANAERQMLRSVYDLGDPSGYCLDIPGFGPRMRKDAPINTHTCKYDRPGFSIDEEFDVTDSQQLRLPEYNLCMSAGSFEAGSDVFTIDCGLENAHGWTLHDSGRVTPIGNNDLCLTLSGDREFVNSSVGNLIPNSTRQVTLEDCAKVREYFQSWRWSDLAEQNTPSANALRAGMSRGTAVGIRELGYAVKAPETAALFAAEPQMFSAADVSISDEIAYGPADRQRLQVYSGLNRNNPQNKAPVVLMVHGGGFARGGLASFAGGATHLAALGHVVVNMTYPLTPNATWPDGANNVASAVRWIKENAADLKADPDKIFVLGQSAGATNVADFVFRPSLIEGGYPLVAGAILAAPGVEQKAGPTPGPNSDYFGENSDDWASKQVLGNIESASIPVLILVGEYDPEKQRIGTAKLFQDLVVNHGAMTRFRQLKGHNHTSYVGTMGTADTRAAEEILDFIATTQ